MSSNLHHVPSIHLIIIFLSSHRCRLILFLLISLALSSSYLFPRSDLKQATLESKQVKQQHALQSPVNQFSFLISCSPSSLCTLPHTQHTSKPSTRTSKLNSTHALTLPSSLTLLQRELRRPRPVQPVKLGAPLPCLFHAQHAQLAVRPRAPRTRDARRAARPLPDPSRRPVPPR